MNTGTAKSYFNQYLEINRYNMYSWANRCLSLEMIEIKKGGKYTVFSNSGDDKPMKTVGEFVGYTIIGEEGAVCFRTTGEDGKTVLRLIPVSNLIAIEFSDEELVTKKTEPNEKDRMNYIS